MNSRHRRRLFIRKLVVAKGFTFVLLPPTPTFTLLRDGLDLRPSLVYENTHTHANKHVYVEGVQQLWTHIAEKTRVFFRSNVLGTLYVNRRKDTYHSNAITDD